MSLESDNTESFRLKCRLNVVQFVIVILFIFKNVWHLLVLRTPSKQKSPQEEKDIDIVELLRNVDPKEYEKYARMYGITDYRGLLHAIEQLKKERAEESGRQVRVSTITWSDDFESVDV